MRSFSLPMIILGLLLMAGATVAGTNAAQATDISRTTPNGGQVTQSGTYDGETYTGARSRVGAHGATANSSVTCTNGLVDTCRRSFSATDRNGQTYTGTRESARGPLRAGSVGSVTRPDGTTVVRPRVHRR